MWVFRKRSSRRYIIRSERERERERGRKEGGYIKMDKKREKGERN